MTTPSGLQSALRLYASDKVKDRQEGRELILGIFSNRENLLQFQETASRDGGAGWVAFFQCLFQVVVTEKRAAVKKGASTQADRRLAEAIHLVRRMTERTVPHLSRRPLNALFTHMTHLVVFDSAIFAPAALDYAKALRSLLSYPPHLAALEPAGWKALMGICWGALLGDEVNAEDDWADENAETLVESENGTPGPGRARGRGTISQATKELVTLIPLLLTSPAAPLLPPLPSPDSTYSPTPSIAYTLLLKTRRFLSEHTSETDLHLPILRGLNLVLREMELNCRKEFIVGGTKLLPHLAGLWGTKNKMLREQVVIAVRTLLPHVMSRGRGKEKDKDGLAGEALRRLVDWLSKESTFRWGLEALDMAVIRLRSWTDRGSTRSSPFVTQVITPGFDFTHECAMVWVILEVYADCFFYLYDIVEAPHTATPRREQFSKRRRIDSALTTLVSGLHSSSSAAGLLHLQVMLFLIERHWSSLHSEAQVDIRRALLELLDDDSSVTPALQSWAFVALATVAVQPRPLGTDEDPMSDTNALATPSRHTQRTQTEQSHWDRVWSHTIRKLAIRETSRAACLAATIILVSPHVNTPASAVGDLGTLLLQIDVQGLIYPFDSACHFLTVALDIAKGDATLYADGLEEKVMGWLEKWNALDGLKGKGRMDPCLPSDLLGLLQQCCRFQRTAPDEYDARASLPDCSIVDRLLEDEATTSIRDFVLHGQVRQTQIIRPSTSAFATNGDPSPHLVTDPTDLSFLDGLPRRLSILLDKLLATFVSDWQDDPSPASPPERTRRALDLIVLALSYQATLRMNGLREDTECVQEALRLLKLLVPGLRGTGWGQAGERLVWGAFELLCGGARAKDEGWKILLRAGEDSGVRRDILDELRTRESSTNDESYGMSPTLREVWRLPNVLASFREVFDLARLQLEVSEKPIFDNATPATQQPTALYEDDDFGEIRTADADLMPLSKEAVDCQRSATALLRLCVEAPLRAIRLASEDSAPRTDIKLVNTLLGADGSRFVQLGLAICEALRDGQLRLGVSAVDEVLAAIEEMIQSYAYSRDEEFLRFALEFTRATLPVWLHDNARDSELASRAMWIGKFLASKAVRGGVASWRVRLALLRWVDEYLDYEPDWTLWSAEGMDVDASSPKEANTPLSFIQSRLLDPDARVRFLAVTSSAQLFTPHTLTPQAQLEYYHAAVSIQPGHPKHFDGFITDLLWKLNCVIISPHLRAAAIYHLYEIPLSTNDYNTHLQRGLEVVAQRLGVRGIAELYLPHAFMIIRSQIQENQPPLRIPHKLYGFPSHRSFAQAVLEVAGPAILALNAEGLFSSLCEAGGIDPETATKRYFGQTAALVYDDRLGAESQDADEAILPGIGTIFGVHSNQETADLMAGAIESVMSRLFDLIDIQTTESQVAALLDSIDKTGGMGKRFLELSHRPVSPNSTHPDPDVLDEAAAAPTLEPCLSIQQVLDAYTHLRTRFKPPSLLRVVHDSLSRLFFQANRAFLQSEQKRYLRAVALVVALHPREVDNPTIMLFLLGELANLAGEADTRELVLPMLRWGFRQESLPLGHEGMDRVVVQLGQAWSKGRGKGDGGDMTQADSEDWLLREAARWMGVEITSEAAVVATLWPTELAGKVKGLPALDFDSICAVVDRTRHAAPLALSKRLSLAARTEADSRRFKTRIFWELKDGLKTQAQDSLQEHVALLDLLDMGDGGITAPDDRNAKDAYERLSPSFGKDPVGLLQAVVVEHVVELVHAEDYRLREEALRCLRSMLASGSVTNPAVLRSAAGLTDLLIPATMSTSFGGGGDGIGSNLRELAEDDAMIKRSRSYVDWTTSIATQLCKNASIDAEFYACILPLLAQAPHLASKLLPVLVQASLSLPLTPSPASATDPSAESQAVTETSTILAQYLSAILRYPSAAVETLQSILDIVLHFRRVDAAGRRVPTGYAEWINIEPLLLSEASIRCGAFATAMLFLELAKSDWSGGEAMDMSGPRAQKIMYEVYSNIDDPDGFYGIKTHDVKTALVRRLEHEGDHWRAFGMNMAELEAPTMSLTGFSASRTAFSIAATKNLHHLGFDRISNTVLKSSRSGASRQGAEEQDPILLELAWRTGDWDVPLPATLQATSLGSFYGALRAVHRERDERAALAAVQGAIGQEMARLGELGIERIAVIRRCVEALMCLKDMAGWLGEGVQKALSQGDFSAGVITAFTRLKPSIEFRDAERRLAVRQSLFRASRARASKDLLGDLTSPQVDGLQALEKSCHLTLGKLAREDDNVQAAINAIVAVQALEQGVMLKESAEAQNEWAEVLWAMGEHGLAVQSLEEIVTTLRSGREKAGSTGSRLATLLSRIANWTSLAKLRAASEIRSTFAEAYQLAGKHGVSPGERAKLCHDFAIFADNHQNVLASSPELESLRRYSRRKEEEIGIGISNTPVPSNRASKSASKTTQRVQQELDEDQRRIDQLEAERTAFIKLALDMWSTSLTMSDEYDDSVTRLVSLWMEHEDRESISASLKTHLDRIPSHKFIFLGPQLAARLDSPKKPSDFNVSLNNLMLRMARQHPYHILYQIITLASDFTAPAKTRRSTDGGAEGRGPAAANILHVIASDGQESLAKQAAKEMKMFSDAAVPWSLTKEEKDAHAGREYLVPAGCPMLQLKDLSVPVPTCPPQIDPTGKYGGIATVKRYRSRYTLLGGVHRPKKMKVFDSNGREYAEMYKGEDEVRQDAVMEQVFEMTNTLLSRDRRTRKRQLRFRTYVVIPLARSTGVIEFVGNSRSIGDWLKPAHARYGKLTADISADKIRSTLKPIQEKDTASPLLPQRFAELLGRFHPVMRHFFTECRPDPMGWLAMRTRYSRSVAVTSMVGWVLGVGDRHCSNILIDVKSGEMVHIDFGIVFEEGRRLRIPEKVPFRLTQDMVDGFGITGVDGTFRRCSEQTLRVLRESAGLVMTVLEVFKHDPLYGWTGDPDKLNRAQPGGRSALEAMQQSATVQEKADRVLSRIRQKLRGDLSVEYQVNELILEARDVGNLSRIFVGWQPWL